MADMGTAVISVRIEIENRDEVLRLYHALANFLMATAPLPEPDKEA